MLMTAGKGNESEDGGSDGRHDLLAWRSRSSSVNGYGTGTPRHGQRIVRQAGISQDETQWAAREWLVRLDEE